VGVGEWESGGVGEWGGKIFSVSLEPQHPSVKSVKSIKSVRQCVSELFSNLYSNPRIICGFLTPSPRVRGGLGWGKNFTTHLGLL